MSSRHEPSRLAAHLLVAAAEASEERDLLVDRAAVEMIPDGISQQALGQLTFVAGRALDRLAMLEGRSTLAILDELWPELAEERQGWVT